MNRLVPLALLSAFLAVPALAAPETFVIDTNHTKPRFEYNHFGYSTQLSRFDTVSGKVVLDAAARTGSVDVSIDAKSVNTGYALFNEHIQGEDFLDTAKYPTITFKSTKVKFKGNKPDSVTGDLTIKGVTKPVTLKITSFQRMAHPLAKKDAIGANATARIKRSEFNAGKYAPNVGDTLTLNLPLEAIAE